MNRDFFSGAYMQLAEIQPPLHYHHHYDLPQASSSATSYDVTAGGERLSCSGPPPPVMLSVHQQHQDIRKRRVSPFSDDYEAMPSCDLANQAPQPVTMKVPSKRRKAASCGAGSAYDDDGEDSRSIRTLPDKKQNHSEIEKRRRDKMNTYITELAAIVPMCGAMARKLDKLTVLRMTAQHIRSVRGALSSCPLTACPRPAYVTEQELNELVLAAGREAFVLVVGCDRGRLLYVSASVTSMLHYDNSELLGQSIFDILHPKDVAKVKEQLSSSDLSPRERLIDAKTMLPVKADTGVGATRLCPGARRSFFCRIKTKTAPGPDAPSARGPQGPQIKEELDSGGKLRKKNERKYCVVQCTGYMKSWAPAEIEEAEAGGSGGEEEASNPSCLVAVGRALHHMIPAPPGAHRPRTAPLQYLSRHANDGKFLFVDPRVTLVLGFLPQELLGTSLYEYVSGPELAAVARAHKAALVQRDALRTTPYAVRCKDGSHALIQSHFKPFRNPWTKDVECLVAENTVITDAPPRSYDGLHHSENMAANAGGGCVSESDMEVQRLIDSQVESHKIGSAIAEEALRRSPNGGLSLDLPADMLHDALFSNNALVDTMLAEDANEMQVRNNVTLSEAAGDDRSPEEALGSPSSITMDGNGEAAMAVIMSLLEADAGLGGPVNFSGLPWPLP